MRELELKGHLDDPPDGETHEADLREQMNYLYLGEEVKGHEEASRKKIDWVEGEFV